MKRVAIPALALVVLLVAFPASAQTATVSATAGVYTSSKWLEPTGLVLAAEGDLSLGEHLAVGLRGEAFGIESSSSDHAHYDRQTVSGWGVGPLVRYRFRRHAVVDPYLGARLQLERGVRGQPGQQTTQVCLAVGAEAGVDFHLGPMILGVFYSVDVPTSHYEDFGGVRYPLYFPGLRVGATF